MIQICENCLREIRGGARYIERIIFSVKCIFSVLLKVNKRNCRTQHSERPAVILKIYRHLPTLVLGSLYRGTK